MWCELCDDKIINDSVIIRGRELGVCSHCKSLCAEDESER